jgi:hypothetical protein
MISDFEVFLQWRADQLEAAGLGHLEALKVAANERFDLHALLELIDRGCPPELAVRILRPLE